MDGAARVKWGLFSKFYHVRQAIPFITCSRDLLQDCGHYLGREDAVVLRATIAVVQIGVKSRTPLEARQTTCNSLKSVG